MSEGRAWPVSGPDYIMAGPEPASCPRMLQIHPVPAFSDNYIWLLHDAAGNAMAVDPGDAEPVIAYIEAASLRLCGILVTHHHPDHTGGVRALQERFGEVPVLGPAVSPYGGVTQALSDGDVVELLGQCATVFAVPGHTLDHIAFFLPADAGGQPILFCGDTLFGGGCGRVFEGNPAMMHASLSVLSDLPAETRVCCAHEYTLSNLRFAVAVEPGNAELIARQARDAARREQNLPTLPSTIGLEMATNPFLRCHLPGVRAAASGHTTGELVSPADVFSVIRAWKDVFR